MGLSKHLKMYNWNKCNKNFKNWSNLRGIPRGEAIVTIDRRTETKVGSISGVVELFRNYSSVLMMRKITSKIFGNC